MMPAPRTLPASLASRFVGARRGVARSAAGSFELVVAEGFALRLRGLTGLEADEIPPLLFPRCRSLHTHRMRSAIDVAWLDLRLADDAGEAEVLRVDDGLVPGRWTRCPGGLDRVAKRRVAALELPPGAASEFGLGQAPLEVSLAPGFGVSRIG